ncbi:1-aminocyclopropane-1-carboxylate deaminase like protein [Verticillium longisporum]|uniref:1-aminocyclopropane-1-carboxylate deaminase like protein n=1 Tax=Verticillium longisporum TaxID=100787 RepID=A0A8I2ZPD1_VERLO|nr:1-aminocyclopropane-1-carboxylate deaminase like protein [Verticillium longisporum]
MSVALPEPFASIPRESFLFGHSPIQALPRISQALGGKVNVYAKREDCNSGLAYGGNKTRKLEYLASEALAQGCDTLVSIGGVQSNHTRQVTAVATKLGLRAALAELADAGRKPYYIPAGASDHPLGGLGFARWAYEVEAQEKELGVFFDTVIVCAVTGSTMAGMVAGFKLAQKNGSPKRKVIGIDASAKVQQTFDQVLRIAKATGAKIGLEEGDITEADIILDDRYHAGVYGIPDQTTIDAMKFGASTEGFITDPVYEGKSLAGMMDIIRKGELAEGSNVLYAHLGGQLALNAYSSL